ncbi:MAG TPA: hypothetical protein DCL35_02365 [Candidatus Omnitrophica bacterium]|nr:hypothetical protein [Candidatus Omnitrophota bacterium]
MKILFVATGWENISIEYLSSYLKARGHQTGLAYDQALFDDKNYVCIPWLYRLLDQKENCLRQIIDFQPDLVAFSVMSVTFQWALGMAELVKKHLDVPIIFGGAHPSSVPEVVIKKDAVDMVCLGEGEEAMTDLCKALEKKEVRYDIPNIWFKKDGQVYRNERRPQIGDINTLPFLDKELFSRHIPIKNYYVAVIARGCPYQCSYCYVSHDTKEAKKTGGRAVRERTVDNVLEELKCMKEKFRYRWIDFRNSVFSTSPEWTTEFCRRYKEEINVPFRIFSHPKLIWNDTVAIALREAGCFAVQVGLESFDEDLRKNVLNRNMTNEEIFRAVDILERNRLSYSLDYILGIPGQTEEECIRAAEFFSKLHYCHRISPFMCQYLPGLDLLNHSRKKESLSVQEIDRINEGLHGNYMSGGSVVDEKYDTFIVYKIFFRSMSFMPPWLKKMLVKRKVYIFLKMAPRFFASLIKLFDLLILIKDLDARTYFYNYCWWFFRRFDPRHPSFWFYGRKYRSEVHKHFRTKIASAGSC